MQLAHLNAFALAAIALGSALLFFALLALRYEEHLFAKRFGDPLRNNAFIEASQQLLNGFTVSSFYFHSTGRSVWTDVNSQTTAMLTSSQPMNSRRAGWYYYYTGWNDEAQMRCEAYGSRDAWPQIRPSL